jgi:predicted esterase
MLSKNTTYLFIGFLFVLAKGNADNSIKPIEYLSQTPIIDGQLDANLKGLVNREFGNFFQFDNPVTEKIPVSYKLGYTETHLYVYIEAKADKITYHRRGYLWGDGYKVLLAIPQSNNQTNEYYELTFSPSLDKNYWDRQTIAVFNFMQAHNKFSDKTFSQESAINGVSGFEALIAWSDIEPYHPWFLNKIGFNLYFAKAVENFTNGYAVVEDEGIWDEELPMRNYKIVEFQQPKLTHKNILIAKPNKTNLKLGESLVIDTIGVSEKDLTGQTIKFIIRNKDAKIVFQQTKHLQSNTKLTKKSYRLKTNHLSSGIYNLTIDYPNQAAASYPIGILPEIDFISMHQKLQENKDKLATGIMHTLQFKLLQIKSKFAQLKPYESGRNVLNLFSEFQQEYQQFIHAINPYKNRIKPYRRAFKSKIDKTYQPYTIKLPKDYDGSKSYPLLVFLHGSGQDEQAILNQARSAGNFIELAPYARDKFQAYASVASQIDIIEAIEDVKQNFNINEDSIVIGGFSMGGYGALRTFYEHPELYKGIAVFAGHPNLASEWLDQLHPNFLQEKYLLAFKNKPVFIYHGEKDAALPIALIKKMSQKLNENGAIVTHRFINEKAHEYPDIETNQLYFEWLNELIKN